VDCCLDCTPKNTENMADENKIPQEPTNFAPDIEDIQWHYWYDKLFDYCDNSTSCNVIITANSTAEEYILSDWTNKQRIARTKGLLNDSRIESLNDLGFDWNITTTALWKLQEMLVAPKPLPLKRKKEPKPKIKKLADEGYVEEKDMLQGDDQEDLEYIDPFEVNDFDEFEDSEGSTENDSGDDEEEYEQTTKRKKNNIKDYRKICWMERFSDLIAFKLEHGDCMVPQKSGSLGLWVRNQRYERRKGKLSQERIKLLNDLGFEWNPTARTANLNIF